MRLGPHATAELLDIWEASGQNCKKAARIYIERQGPTYPLTREMIYWILLYTVADAKIIARRLTVPTLW